MNRHFRRLTTLLGSLLIICGALVTGLTPTLAAPSATDPLVVIARDTTNLSHCIMIHNNGTGTVSSPCPAGTVISSIQVSLSEAMAEHEVYVLLPARSISSAEAAKVTQQIQDMMRAKGNQIHHQTSTTMLSPLMKFLPATCSLWAQLGEGVIWSPWFDTTHSLNSWLDYQVDGACDLDWLDSKITLSGSGGPLYWDRDQYSSWSASYGCASLPSGLKTEYPGGNFNPPGYYYEQFVYNGSGCWPWDDSDYVDIGPLTNY